MNKDVADKWVKALRSDEYTQSTNYLQNGAGHCCLGVLCEIGRNSGVLINKSLGGQIKGETLNDQSAIKKWAGMRTGQGKFKFKHPNNNLTALNDEGYTFEEIADIIEKEWEDL